MGNSRRLAGSMLGFFLGMVVTLLLHAGLAAAGGAPPSKIPLSVSDVRVLDTGRMMFTLHNNSPDWLVAWSLELEYLYADGHRGSRGITAHCHLTALEEGALECEVGPGESREERLFFSARNGQLPTLRAARFLGAVFETPGSPVEKWLGDRERIDEMVRTHARRQLAWQELLRVLEGATKEHALTSAAVRVAYEELGGEASEDTVREGVRNQLKGLLERVARGEVSEADAVAGLLRTARLVSAPPPWLESHRGR